MTDTLALDFAIKKAGFDRQKVAKSLGISMMALFNKIHNRTEFKASEIARLVDMLRLTSKETKNIFFK